MEVNANKGSTEAYIAIYGENELRSRGFNQALLTIEEALELLAGNDLKMCIAAALAMEAPKVKAHKKNMALAKKLGVL